MDEDKHASPTAMEEDNEEVEVNIETNDMEENLPTPTIPAPLVVSHPKDASFFHPCSSIKKS